MMCERAVKLAEGGWDLACRGMTFVYLDSSDRLLEASCNIVEASQMMLSLL